MASVRHDAAVQSAQQSIDAVVASFIPPHTPPHAMTKVRQYLMEHPVDSLIVHARIQITHIQNAQTGKEEKHNRSDTYTLEEALSMAQERQMNLVQMGERPGVAYCRIRHERPWIIKLIKDDLAQVEVDTGNKSPSSASAGTAAASNISTASSMPYDGKREEEGDNKNSSSILSVNNNMSDVNNDNDTLNKTNNLTLETSKKTKRPRKILPLIEHSFRDIVDAHFVGWRSKKICQDLRKGHTVRLCIKEFQTSESAVHKLKEMCAAMKNYAEQENIEHYYTSITANDREAGISFSPVLATSASETSSNNSGGNSSSNKPKGVKHPTEKEWTNTERRMREACERVGRPGTYIKSNKLKPRNLGTTFYRVDKYGRRTDEASKVSIHLSDK